MVRNWGGKYNVTSGTKLPALPYGSVGTIVNMDYFPPGAYRNIVISKPIECCVAFDGAQRRGCAFYQLEPLTDPGREVVEWDACLWKPEHLRENTHA